MCTWARGGPFLRPHVLHWDGGDKSSNLRDPVTLRGLRGAWCASGWSAGRDGQV